MLKVVLNKINKNQVIKVFLRSSLLKVSATIKTQQKHNFNIALFTLLFSILLGSCKKAETDEEMREMIIGTWKVKTENASPPKSDTYQIIEFNEEMKYRWLEYYGTNRTWDSADGSGISDQDIITSSIGWGDSIYYEINNGELIFSRIGSLPDYDPAQLGFSSESLNIKKLTNSKLDLDEGYVFKRQ